jgi:hypothetical protein
MNRGLLLHLWLAFLLVFNQQGAYAHALSHLRESPPPQSQPDKSLPHHDVCAQCAAYGHAGHAIPPSFVIFTPAPDISASASLIAFSFSVQAVQSYLSRAPPRLV